MGRPGKGGPGTLVTTGVRLLIIALPTYFVWEMLKTPAFTGMPPGWWAATAVCALAAVGDGVIVLAVFGIGAGLYRDWRWFAPPRPGRFAIVVLTGVIVHVAIEWVMVHRLGRCGRVVWRAEGHIRDAAGHPPHPPRGARSPGRPLPALSAAPGFGRGCLFGF